MKLSARERTGLRAMVELARRYGEGPITLSEIAETQGLPLPYLERVAAQLRDAGLLASVRGAHGGYLLTRAPEEISVSDIFVAVEGNLLTVDCLCPDGSRCELEPTCATRDVMTTVRDCLANTLGQTTLASVIA